MNVIDFHPDELLDREIDETLSLEDRRRLDEHLARCIQCRLERRLRADFELELGAGDDATHVQTVVSGAMRATRPSQAARPSLAPSGATWRKRFILLLAATMVLATGLAAAEGDVAGRVWVTAREKVTNLFWVPTQEPASRRAPSKPRTESTAATAVATVEPSMPVVTAVPESRNGTIEAPKVDAPVADVAMPPVAAPKGPSPFATRRTSVPALKASPDFAAAPAPPKPQNDAPTPEPRDSAASIFDDASTARRRGNTPEAFALYRDLQDRFASSPEARLSLAVVARMRLDNGEPQSAASGFASYLATHDRALREEAMAGLALGLGRLGRSREELDAWRDLLREYPRSSYATIARWRLGQDSP